MRGRGSGTREHLESHLFLPFSLPPSVKHTRTRTHSPGRQKTAEELLGKSPTKAPLESQFKSVFRQRFCEERSPRTGVTVASDSAHLCCPKQCAQLRQWPVTRGGTPQAHEDQEAPHFTLIWFMRSWSGTFLMNVGKEAGLCWAVRGSRPTATASCLRTRLQVLCPSTNFIPSGTVPLFHKILCIRSFPSGPVSSIF